MNQASTQKTEASRDLCRRAYLAEVMEEPLSDEGEEQDDGAGRRHDPRQRELQSRRLGLLLAPACHLPFLSPRRRTDNDTLPPPETTTRALVRGRGGGSEWKRNCFVAMI
jgi:hypothetical protein